MLKKPKQPWIAAGLALFLGGPGCFYLDWRRGTKATFAWLLALFFISAGPHFPESIIFSVLLVHAVLAWKAYRGCRRLNSEAAGRHPAAASIAGDKPLTSWRRIGRGFDTTVRVIANGFGLLLLWFFTQLFVLSWHYTRLQRSIRSGMTIAEVLHTVHESGLVSGRPQTAEGDTQPDRGIALSGPHDGRYHRISGGPANSASEAEAAILLQQDMLPGRDYRVGFTFTPTPGPHWSMTVVLNPDGRVKEVQPFHTWD